MFKTIRITLIGFSKGIFVLRKIIELVFIPFKKIGILFFELGIVPVYNLYYKFKSHKNPKRAVSGASVSFLGVLRSHSSHLIFGIMIGVTVIYNIRSHSLYAEDFGVNTPLYTLTQGQEDVIVETASFHSFPFESIPEEGWFVSAEDHPQESPGIDTDDLSVGILDDEFTLSAESLTISLEAKNREKTIDYSVQDGDTVSSIARQFGISINTILWENRLTARSVIRPGNTLRILPFSGISYTVKKGDTLAKIAARFQIALEELVGANRLADDAPLALNQVMVVPGAKPISPPLSQGRPSGSGSTRPGRLVISGNHTGYLWPSPGKRINQYFSWKHTGIDIDNLTLNDPIYASLGGVVEKSGWGGAYGNRVDLRHSDGTLTRYGHLKTIYVKRGERLEKGDALGIMGTTGRSTGIHLHFEIIINGKRVNPLSYL